MSVDLWHPSSVVSGESIALLQKRGHDAEILRQLHDDQLDLIIHNKWFKMFVPRDYGGLGLTLPEILKIEECLAWADGSTGWVVTLCAGAAWFIGFIDSALADELFASHEMCIAGSGAVTGVAEITDKGYEISGIWKYASGSLHATAFTANCALRKDGHQLLNPDGSPKISAFIFKREEVTVHSTWGAMGMIATGSHSFEVTRLRVPAGRAFTIDPFHTVRHDPIYKYPFMQLAETTLAVNMSGMSVRFIDLAVAMIGRPSGDDHILKARTTLNSCRKLFFDTVEDSYRHLVFNNSLDASVMEEVSRRSHELVNVSRDVVNALYPQCGLSAAQTDSEINRVWRNFHTAGQHALFKPLRGFAQ